MSDVPSKMPSKEDKPASKESAPSAAAAEKASAGEDAPMPTARENTAKKDVGKDTNKGQMLFDDLLVKIE